MSDRRQDHRLHQGQGQGRGRGDQPFFTYIGLANMHPPEAVHPDFDQTDPSRLGLYADLIAELDHRVGQIMDCLDEAGVADDTLLVFSSDNGGLIDTVPHGCSSGPFRGGFFTRGGMVRRALRPWSATPERCRRAW